MSLIQISSGMPLIPKDAVAVSETRWRGKGLATYRESAFVPHSGARIWEASHWRSAEKIVLSRLLMRSTCGGLGRLWGRLCRLVNEARVPLDSVRKDRASRLGWVRAELCVERSPPPGAFQAAAF